MDRSAFLRAMRRVASSVSVVTTDGPAGRHGATVSAFCSVSADPPTVLVCLNAASRIAATVRENAVFAVNVLPEGARHRRPLRRAPRRGGPFSTASTGAAGRAPQYPRRDGAVCEVADAPLSGTHLVVLGRVVEAVEGAARPLAYHDGGFHRVVPLAEGRPA